MYWYRLGLQRGLSITTNPDIDISLLEVAVC